MLCAGIIEVIDLGIDRILLGSAVQQSVYLHKLLSITEFLLGSVSTILAGYSLDQFLLFIRRKFVELVGIKL
jgi:hypothetical protein